MDALRNRLASHEQLQQEVGGGSVLPSCASVLSVWDDLSRLGPAAR
jgi:hypothetical protein